MRARVQIFWLALSSILPLAGQQVPGHYIVELTEPPVGVGSAAGRRLPDARRRVRLRDQQERFTRQLPMLRGRALSEMEHLINAVVIRLPENLVERIESLPGVRRIYPVNLFKAEMNEALAVHGVPHVWQRIGGIERAGEGVKIAILDSCIDVQHPAFRDPLIPMPPGYPRASRPEDLAWTSNKVIVTRNYKPMYGGVGDQSPKPVGAHGTQVASAAAAVPHASPQGVISGIAPKAWLGNYCIASPDPTTDTLYRSDVIAKALDDAVADGMDVVNMSLSYPARQLRPEDDILAEMGQRATELGVIMLKSAGNYGPRPNTIGSGSSFPAYITVGATWNSRYFGAKMLFGGQEYDAIPSGATETQPPITGLVTDVGTLDGTGFACTDLPAGSLVGKIALTRVGGGCITADKATKLAAAGAMGAIISADLKQFDMFSMGRRAVPSVAISYGDGESIRARLTANPTLQATLRFQTSELPINPHRMASFSSRGPTGTHQIKPDLVAVGKDLYTAEPGNSHGYALGTSFSTPIVAGAAAVLRSARPELTVRQYRSLLINTASPPNIGGEPARVMDYGAGVLNLEAALTGTVAAYPTSLNFGVAAGTFRSSLRLLVMNLARADANISVSVKPYGGGPAPTLSAAALGVPAGQARPVTVSFQQAGLAPGEYQGFVELRSGDGSLARVPYWAATPFAEPSFITFLVTRATGTAGRRLDGAAIFRVTDRNGIILNGVPVRATVVKGGGSVERVYSRDGVFPGEQVMDVTLGAAAGENVFRLQAGSVQEDVLIQGAAATANPTAALDTARLPLVLEPNRGQAPEQVDFLSRSVSAQILLSGQSVILRARGTTAAVRMELVGADPGSRWQAESPLSGVSNYLIGADPAHWRIGVPHYSKARLGLPYPGIDMVVYGNEGRLEFDFVVEPGANPSHIRMRYRGVEATSINDEGALVLQFEAGEVHQQRPIIYQELASGKRPVSGEYVRLGTDEYGFRVGEYDRSQPLVIDPIFTFGTYLGGSGLDAGHAIAVDARGQTYIAGSTESANFPVTAGAHSGGTQPADAFVTKLKADGSGIEYSTFLGGTRDDKAVGIAIDGSGAVYITGATFSANFPVTAGVVGRVSRDLAADIRGDAFVAKLPPAGAPLVYATYLSGDEGDAGTSIAIDQAGNAYVTGDTYSDNFPTTGNAARRGSCAGFGYDGFYSKLNANATALSYSTYLCGRGHDLPRSIAVDTSGNAYITGKTNSPDFPTTAGALQTTGGGATDDVFITKVSSAGTIAWSTYLGGTGNDVGEAVRVDLSGRVYIAGTTDSTDLPATAGVVRPDKRDFGQYTDGFVGALEPAGDRLRFLSYFGGSHEDAIHSMVIDEGGALYLSGYTSSPDLPTTSSACLTGYRGNGDAFIAKLNQGASRVDYALFLGGSEKERAHGVAVDPLGNAYLTGQTWSPNFPTTSGSYRPAYEAGFRGVADAFVVKVGPEPAPTNNCVAVNGVVNNGSMLPGPVSPGEIISIFGAGLGPAAPVLSHLEGNYLATRVGGTRVLFDNVPAPLIFSYTSQVAAIVPYSVKGTTMMEVEYLGARTPAVRLGVADASPAILTQNSSGKGAGAILNQDYTLNTPANPAARGSYVMIYATGEGQTLPPGVTGALAIDRLPTPILPVRVLFGEITSPDVPYRGAAPGQVAGLFQVNAQVPENVTPGNAVPLALVVGDKRSPPGVTIAVK